VEHDAAWWRMWYRRRDIDDWRLWRGRTHKAVLFQLDPVRTARDGGLPVNVLVGYGAFEDQLVETLDAAAALDRLTVRQRMILAYRVWGYRPPEIAAILGDTITAVDTCLSTTRRKLRRLTA